MASAMAEPKTPDAPETDVPCAHLMLLETQIELLKLKVDPAALFRCDAHDLMMHARDFLPPECLL